MAPNTVPNNPRQGDLIRQRREANGIKLADAAKRAGISEVTWRKYEEGGAIRSDKVAGVCRALGITGGLQTLDPENNVSEFEQRLIDGLPAGHPLTDRHVVLDVDALDEKEFDAAVEAAQMACMVSGFEMTDQWIKDALEEIEQQPRGTHLGQLGWTAIREYLPEQWRTRYDYDFLWKLRQQVKTVYLRTRLGDNIDGLPFLVRCPADDIVLKTMMLLGADIFEMTARFGHWTEGDVEGWIEDWSGDAARTIDEIFSGTPREPDDPFHFDNWFTWSYFGLTDDDQRLMGKDGGIRVRTIEMMQILESNTLIETFNPPVYRATAQKILARLGVSPTDRSTRPRPTPSRTGRDEGVRPILAPSSPPGSRAPVGE